MPCPRLEPVNCSRGAPMGRAYWCHAPAGATVKCHLIREHLDGGGYDSGGAYWGSPSNLYRLEAADGAEVRMFFRAGSREHAKRKARKYFFHLTLKFFR